MVNNSLLLTTVVSAILLVNAIAGNANVWMEWKDTTKKHLFSHNFMGAEYASWRSSVTGLRKVPSVSDSTKKAKRNLQGYSSASSLSTAPSTFNIMISYVGETSPYSVLGYALDGCYCGYNKATGNDSCSYSSAVSYTDPVTSKSGYYFTTKYYLNTSCDGVPSHTSTQNTTQVPTFVTEEDCNGNPLNTTATFSVTSSPGYSVYTKGVLTFDYGSEELCNAGEWVQYIYYQPPICGVLPNSCPTLNSTIGGDGLGNLVITTYTNSECNVIQQDTTIYSTTLCKPSNDDGNTNDPYTTVVDYSYEATIGYPLNIQFDDDSIGKITISKAAYAVLIVFVFVGVGVGILGTWFVLTVCLRPKAPLSAATDKQTNASL